MNLIYFFRIDAVATTVRSSGLPPQWIVEFNSAQFSFAVFREIRVSRLNSKKNLFISIAEIWEWKKQLRTTASIGNEIWIINFVQKVWKMQKKANWNS